MNPNNATIPTDQLDQLEERQKNFKIVDDIVVRDQGTLFKAFTSRISNLYMVIWELTKRFLKKQRFRERHTKIVKACLVYERRKDTQNKRPKGSLQTTKRRNSQKSRN